MPAVRSKNERVELEMRILRYRRLASRTADEEFLRRVKEQVAELEQKLREIDESKQESRASVLIQSEPIVL
jgi:hypothetical protein